KGDGNVPGIVVGNDRSGVLHARYHAGELAPVMPNSTATRSSSATLQACAIQPPGRWGGSPSNTSGICPRPFVRMYCHSATGGHGRFTLKQAVMNGPSSHGQTVPW